jgi:predicted transcriptional regulator of viral defense system
VKAPYQEWSENEFIIADALMDGRNYYIGYNNMFNFYDFSQQIPQTTFILNTRFSKRRTIDGESYKPEFNKQVQHLG